MPSLAPQCPANVRWFQGVGQPIERGLLRLLRSVQRTSPGFKGGHAAPGVAELKAVVALKRELARPKPRAPFGVLCFSEGQDVL